ncbi:MAG: alpha/beta fold hydrolase [Myxococcaceae bacterium]|nr:MAG: alpha/beta fold hydrolase [Myxococcaceae bacterium]
MATLAHTELTAGPNPPERWVLFLHGLLGRGGNWRSFGRRWVETHPTWGAVLVDLRLHGDSSTGFDPPHAVGAAAGDVLALLPALPGPVEALVGHSLGAKVVLALQRASGHRFPRAVVIDASPSPRPDDLGAEQSREILALLARLPRTYATRTEFVTAVEAAGQPRSIAQWLAMALQPQGGRFVLSLDLAGLESLYESVLAEDDWDVVTSVPPGHRLAFIVGGASSTVEPAARERIRTLAPAVTLEEIPGAGHWVHVDAPDATFAAVERALRPP